MNIIVIIKFMRISFATKLPSGWWPLGIFFAGGGGGGGGVLVCMTVQTHNEFITTGGFPTARKFKEATSDDIHRAFIWSRIQQFAEQSSSIV